jgi:chromosome partitioning protein
MTRKIATCNQKGGVAKTATVHQLAAWLANKGKKVLLIDLDPQFNLTSCIGADAAKLEEENCTIYNVLRGDKKISEVVVKIGKFDLAASTTLLSRADGEFSGTKAPYLLKKALSEIESNYDYVLIDTPPTLGVLTVNGLTAANGIIIPYKADALTVMGVGQLVEAIGEVKEYANKDLKINGIVITMFDTRTKISKSTEEIVDKLAKQLKTKVYTARIRQCAAMRELPGTQQDIFTYDPKCAAAQDYAAFGDEVLGEGK